MVLAGIWVTGGLVTNDFAVAMWLTAAWMGAACLACLVVAARSWALRWPALGAYALTAVVAGAYLGFSQFLDDEVMERVAVAAPGTPVRAGAFEAVRHPARGEARIAEPARGERVLTLTGFEVDNGPDLRVYLVAGPARSEGEVDDFVDLGALKGNKSDQQCALPAGLDDRYATAGISCRAFSVLFARAPLGA